MESEKINPVGRPPLSYEVRQVGKRVPLDIYPEIIKIIERKVKKWLKEFEKNKINNR